MGIKDGAKEKIQSEKAMKIFMSDSSDSEIFVQKKETKKDRKKTKKSAARLLFPTFFEITIFLLNLTYPTMCYFVFSMQLKYFITIKNSYFTAYPDMTDEIYGRHVENYKIKMGKCIISLLNYTPIGFEAIVRILAFVFEKWNLLTFSNGFMMVLFWLFYIAEAFSCFSLFIKASHLEESNLVFILIFVLVVVILFLFTMLIKNEYRRYYIRLVYMVSTTFILILLYSIFRREIVPDDSKYLKPPFLNDDVNRLKELVDAFFIDNNIPRKIKYRFSEKTTLVDSICRLNSKVIYINPKFRICNGNSEIFNGLLMEKYSELATNKSTFINMFLIAYIVLALVVITLFVVFQEKTSNFDMFFHVMWLYALAFQFGVLFRNVISYAFKYRADGFFLAKSGGSVVIKLLKSIYYTKNMQDNYAYYANRGHMLMLTIPSQYSRIKRAERRV